MATQWLFISGLRFGVVLMASSYVRMRPRPMGNLRTALWPPLPECDIRMRFALRWISACCLRYGRSPADCLTLPRPGGNSHQRPAETGKPLLAWLLRRSWGEAAQRPQRRARECGRVTPIRIRQLTSQALGEATFMTSISTFARHAAVVTA